MTRCAGDSDTGTTAKLSTLLNTKGRILLLTHDIYNTLSGGIKALANLSCSVHHPYGRLWISPSGPRRRACLRLHCLPQRSLPWTTCPMQHLPRPKIHGICFSIVAVEGCQEKVKKSERRGAAAHLLPWPSSSPPLQLHPLLYSQTPRLLHQASLQTAPQP